MPWAPGPKCKFFFTFRCCRQLDGRHAPILENFPIRHIFLKFCFFKYKNKKGPGSPSFLRAGSPRGILSRGVQHAPLEARSVGVSGPGEPNNPVESHPTYTHRGEVPVPRLASRSREVEQQSAATACRSPPTISRRPFSSAGVPAATSSFVSGDSPSPSPFISLPLLGFLLSSPLIFFL